jgi:hypothetical protein
LQVVRGLQRLKAEKTAFERFEKFGRFSLIAAHEMKKRQRGAVAVENVQSKRGKQPTKTAQVSN